MHVVKCFLPHSLRWKGSDIAKNGPPQAGHETVFGLLEKSAIPDELVSKPQTTCSSETPSLTPTTKAPKKKKKKKGKRRRKEEEERGEGKRGRKEEGKRGGDREGKRRRKGEGKRIQIQIQD
jgi:hypothetical protein